MEASSAGGSGGLTANAIAVVEAKAAIASW